VIAVVKLVVKASVVTPSEGEVRGLAPCGGLRRRVRRAFRVRTAKDQTSWESNPYSSTGAHSDPARTGRVYPMFNVDSSPPTRGPQPEDVHSSNRAPLATQAVVSDARTPDSTFSVLNVIERRQHCNRVA
jgi:hypothetical protein